MGSRGGYRRGREWPRGLSFKEEGQDREGTEGDRDTKGLCTLHTCRPRSGQSEAQECALKWSF